MPSASPAICRSDKASGAGRPARAGVDRSDVETDHVHSSPTIHPTSADGNTARRPKKHNQILDFLAHVGGYNVGQIRRTGRDGRYRMLRIIAKGSSRQTSSVELLQQDKDILQEYDNDRVGLYAKLIRK